MFEVAAWYQSKYSRQLIRVLFRT